MTTLECCRCDKEVKTNFDFMVFVLIDFYVLIALFIFYEYLIRKDERSPFKFKSNVVRLLLYTIIILSMLLFYDDSIDRSFIYFQF